MKKNGLLQQRLERAIAPLVKCVRSALVIHFMIRFLLLRFHTKLKVFSHWFSDVLGPLHIHENMELNYCLVITDSTSRWPGFFPLRK